MRSSLTGPFPWWADLFPPPMGYRWKRLTSIDHSFELETGGRVSFPLPYLVKLPPAGVEKYWELQVRIDAMKEDSRNRQTPGKWKMPEGEPFWEKLPTLAQYCTDFWWEETKKPRIPCKIAMTFFEGAVNLSLNDEEKRRSCHTTAQTVREALELLEAHLEAGTAPWRSWGKQR